MQDRCLLRGNCIVVPPEGRDKVMELIVTLGISWKLEDEITGTFICLVA